MKRALLWLLIASPAYADAPLALRLAASPDQLHRERTVALEQQLVRALNALPGVERAEVQLTLPLPFAEALDTEPTRPRAAVVLVCRSAECAGTDAFSLLHHALPALQRDDLTLIQRTPRAEASNSFVQVGPFRVHPSSASLLRVWLAISLLANVLLACFVLLRLRRP